AGGTAWVDQAWADGDFAKVLVLADSDAGCGFEGTTLHYADGTAADAMAFVTINYLVRLWRRLGWSIVDVDPALSVFLPGTPDPRTGPTVGPAMATALLGLGHLDALAATLGVSARNRGRLLALWAPLDPVQYAALFLSRSALSDDAVFDHPLGRYLS